MQHWNEIIPAFPWPQKCSLHCACSLVDPKVLSSSHCHHLHQESADKSHTWLPCPPPDLSVTEKEVVGLDPKMLLLWGDVEGRSPRMDVWILNVATLTWEQVEDQVTKICCYSNMCIFYLGSNTTACWSSTYLLFNMCAPPSTSPSSRASGRKL